MEFNFDKLTELLLQRKEVQNVEEHKDGIAVTIRSYIALYDEDVQDWILNHVDQQVFPAEAKEIIKRIAEYEQEHKYYICSEYIEVVRHNPDEAFGNIFIDLGSYELPLRRAVQERQYNRIVDLMIARVSSFDLADSELLRRFINWANKTNI